MSNAGLIALATLASAVLGSTATAQSWEANNYKDAITDKISREACSTQSQFRLCLSFEADGVWAVIRSLGPDLFDTQLFPALRIDQNEAVESVTPGTLSLERTLGSEMIPRLWQPS